MANSDTRHSKDLRIKTSKIWRKNNVKTIAFDLNLNKEEDVEIVKFFDEAKSKIGALRSLYKLSRKNE